MVVGRPRADNKGQVGCGVLVACLGNLGAPPTWEPGGTGEPGEPGGTLVSLERDILYKGYRGLQAR